MGAPNDSLQVELKPGQIEFLRHMAEKHGLPDASKALRCLVNYAIDETDREADIFTTIRCRDCG